MTNIPVNDLWPSITIIAYHPEGWEIRLNVATGSEMRERIHWLSNHGYTPQRGFLETPDGLPICPKHGLPMRKREKQGDTWYSHNVGTEEHPMWCRGYAGDNSPGWEFG